MPKARQAYEDLTAAAPAEEVARWMEDASAADAERDDDIEAMDIYDVHSNPCKLSVWIPSAV